MVQLHDTLSFVYTIVQAMFLALITNYLIDRFQEYAQRTSLKKIYAEDEVVIPPRVAAWIPFVGSSYELTQGGGLNAFIRKYATQFQSPVFSATLAGGTVCHFFGKSSDVRIGYTAHKSLDTALYDHEFLVRVCGAHPNVVDHELTPPAKKKGISLFHTAVLNKDNLQQTLTKSQTILKQQTDMLLQQDDAGGNDWKNVNLYEFCMAVMYKTTIGSILSTGGVIEDLVSQFAAWEAGAPLMFAKFPSFLIPGTAIKGREKLLEAMRKKEEQLLKGASKLCKARKEMHSSDFFRRIILALTLDVAGNSIPATFWTIACILSDAEALAAVQQELKEKVKTDSESALYSVPVLDSCTTLHAIFMEVMRLYTSSFTARDVMSDMEVMTSSSSDKGRPKKFLLKEGTRIMACSSILHSDPDVFEEPEKFIWNRFLPNKDGKMPVFTLEGKELAEPVIAFGGGVHKCPGRYFIEHDIKSLVAYLLGNFDVRALSTDLPSVDMQSQGMGIVRPNHGDLAMEVRRHKKV